MTRIVPMLVFVSILTAQPRPTFEVATVRPSANPYSEGKLNREDVQLQPDRLLLGNVRMQTMLMIAFNLRPVQISGPDWIRETFFDVVAKAPGQVTEAQVRVMLQNLLADRFALKSHRETKEAASYVLTVGKTGVKLKDSESAGPGKLRTTKNGLIGEGATMDEFAGVLTQPLGLPVLNQTGLSKRYDFTLDMTPYMPERTPGGPAPDMAAMFITALSEKLGLKLESKRAPVEILMIDRLEKTPTEN